MVSRHEEIAGEFIGVELVDVVVVLSAPVDEGEVELAVLDALVVVPDLVGDREALALGDGDPLPRTCVVVGCATSQMSVERNRSASAPVRIVRASAFTETGSVHPS